MAPSPELAAIRLLCCDADGVLTDGGLYYDEAGRELRRFHVHDGRGIKDLQKAGVTVCVVSASRTPAIRYRAEALGIGYCFTNVEDKVTCVQRLIERLDICAGQVAHVGDDTNDARLFQLVGVPIAVPNGVAAVRPFCRFITARPGGAGAVREIADAIIESLHRYGV